MEEAQFIQAVQHRTTLDAWIKITAVYRERGVTTLSFLSVVLLSALVSAPSRLAAQATRPNIVVIMTDDQRLDDLRVLTKTRRLIGSQGTTFRNHYVSFPLCCPSRVTFLTGQYPHNHGVLANQPPSGGYDKLDHTNTLPVWLQEADYYTSHIGRYLNGYAARHETEIPPGWNDWQTLTSTAMYDYTLNDNGKRVHYGTSEEDYQTDVLADRAVETISEVEARQPFFLSIDVKTPHMEPLRAGFPNPRPAPRHKGAFANEPLPHPPSFNEADVSDKPPRVRNLARVTASEIEKITARYRFQLASLLAVDDLVERVVDQLAATGVLDNTVLIFTSDNGFFHGQHRIQVGKGLPYEEASHVPLLIRGGGFPKGKTASQFVSNVDLARTIVAVTEANARLVMDGRSLLPLAQDPGLATARDLLIENVYYAAVRNKSFLYVEHNTGEQELYDMRPGSANYDPYQLESRHADSAYSEIMAELANKLNELRDCSGESCEVQ